MGKGGQDTNVQVVQNNQQTQEVNVANQTVSDSLKGLIDVLNNQAKNPATYIPVTIVDGQGAAYSDQTLPTLLNLMYWETARGQQNTTAQSSTGQGLPDNLLTLFIAAGIVIIVIMVMRR